MKQIKYRTKVLLSILAYGFSCSLSANSIVEEQVAKKSRKGLFELDWYGFVFQDASVDTRQPVDASFDFSQRPDFDIFGRDINARGQFNMQPVFSRMGVRIKGPYLGSPRDHALLEGDFLGLEQSLERYFRLRHAFFKIYWDDMSFMVGQGWHPFSFPPFDAPRPIALGYGIPTVVYNRSPQLRFTYYGPTYDVVWAALSQLAFVNDGPLLSAVQNDSVLDQPLGLSNIYARNGMVPNLHLQIIFHPREYIHVGFGVDYKRLVPRLFGEPEPDRKIKVYESLNSLAALAYADLNYETWRVTAKATFAGNGTNFNLLGGYAVHCINPVTDAREYTNLYNSAFWVDGYIKGTIEPGIFFGFSKNLGASKTIIPSIVREGEIVSLVYGFGTSINLMLQCAPRLRINYYPYSFGAEIEYSRIEYGTINTQGTVDDITPVGNMRFLIGFYYFF